MGFFGRNARPSSEKAQNEGNAEPEQNETEQIETEQTERVGAADVPKEHVTSSSWTLWQSPHGNASAPKGAWRNHRPERPPTISIRDMPTLPEDRAELERIAEQYPEYRHWRMTMAVRERQRKPAMLGCVISGTTIATVMALMLAGAVPIPRCSDECPDGAPCPGARFMCSYNMTYVGIAVGSFLAVFGPLYWRFLSPCRPISLEKYLAKLFMREIEAEVAAVAEREGSETSVIAPEQV